MVMHTELDIYQAGSKLLETVTQIQVQMERGYKHIVGDKIVTHCAEMLDLVAMANSMRGYQRAEQLRSILAHQRAAENWLRVALNLKKVAPEVWGHAIKSLNSVGKQANGWLSATQGVPAV